MGCMLVTTLLCCLFETAEEFFVFRGFRHRGLLSGWLLSGGVLVRVGLCPGGLCPTPIADKPRDAFELIRL